MKYPIWFEKRPISNENGIYDLVDFYIGQYNTTVARAILKIQDPSDELYSNLRWNGMTAGYSTHENTYRWKNSSGKTSVVLKLLLKLLRIKISPTNERNFISSGTSQTLDGSLNCVKASKASRNSGFYLGDSVEFQKKYLTCRLIHLAEHRCPFQLTATSDWGESNSLR